MLEKIKQYIQSRNTLKAVKHANEYNVIKPFLHGSQLEYRRFGNYLFLKDSKENHEALIKRDFANFKTSIEQHVNWELQDTVLEFGESVLYNKKYNIMVVMIKEDCWNKLNTSVDIAKKTETDIQIQRDILINAYATL